MSANDPTLESLAKLDDPAVYVVRRRVPVFCAHVRRDKSGKVLYRVTDALLHTIAERCNRLYRERGVPSRITLGHTLPGHNVPEHDQPEIVGWARNWDVGPYGPGGVLANVVDEFILRHRVKDVDSYPYRSVEYYPTRGEVSGVAHLRRDPELDLGIVTGDGRVDYAREQRADGPVYYLLGGSAMADDPTTTVPGSTDHDPEFDKKCDGYMDRKYRHLPAMHQAYAATLPPDTGDAPAPGGDTPPPPPTPGGSGGPDQFSRQQEAARYARIERESADIKRELATLRQERSLAQAQALVVQIQAEGYLLRDPTKEAQRLARISEAERAERLDEIRACYQRDPAAGGFVPVASPPTSRADDSVVTPEDLRHAETYMRQHKSSDWEEAKQYAFEQRKK